MTGFLRALRGELYAFAHRRQVRMAFLVVVAGVLLRVGFAALQPALLGSDGTSGTLASAYRNFWPRFAQGARFGLILTELAVLVVLGGLLPREIGLGAARDPLVRRISRTGFAVARAVSAVLLPLALGAAACGAAAGSATLFFDAGNVVTPPVVFDADPARQASFADWCEENGVRPDQLAAWLRRVQDEDLDGPEAARRLGLPAFQLPRAYEDLIPILLFEEAEVRGGIVAGLLHGILPLVALGLFALAFSVLIPTGVLAAGLALGCVLLFGVLLAPELGRDAWWFFADWLPGMGHESQLELARQVADGFGEPAASAGALSTGSFGALIGGAGFLMLVLAVFPRRRL